MVALMTHTHDGPLCPRTDMPVAWCAHCREQANHKRGRRSWGRGQRPRDFRVRARFTARFAGRCVHCDEQFCEGDYIGITSNEDYLCEGCCICP
jgi:hypothetical protein